MSDAITGRRIKIRSGLVRGYRLNVFDGGNPEGHPVVFIHGLTGTLQGWTNQIRHLEPTGKYRLVAYDLDGHGNSDHQAVTIDRQAADLDALLDKLGIRQPVTLVGHSVGGMVAQHYTASHPERVSKLALISSATEFPEDARNALRQFMKTYRSRKRVPFLGHAYYVGLMRHLQREFSEAKPVQPSGMDALPNEKSVENHLNQFLSFRATGLPVSSRPPTLLVCADRDSLFGMSQQKLQELWSGTSEAHLVTISDSRSHLPQLDHPTKVNAVLEDFLEGSVS